jgi:two-component system response regulator NreC
VEQVLLLQFLSQTPGIGMIKVFVTDDHELYLEGLCLLLKKQSGIQVTGSASSGKELLEQLPKLDADILLLDVNLPDMEEEDLIKRIRQINTTVKILYLTMMRGTRYIHKLMKYDIDGYLLKNATIDELKRSLEVVAAGGKYFSKEINIADSDFRNTITIDDNQVSEILSRRELEILKLICKEYSNAQIAEKLFLSISTVETHRKNLISKLGVNNTVGLVKFALKNKLID